MKHTLQHRTSDRKESAQELDRTYTVQTSNRHAQPDKQVKEASAQGDGISKRVWDRRLDSNRMFLCFWPPCEIL